MGKSKMFYGWWIVIGSAILLAVLGPAAVAVANIYQTPIVAQYGITNSQFAISNSLVLGVGVFLSPIVSKQLSGDYFKRYYIISLIIYAVAYVGYGLTTDRMVFYFLSLFVGFGSLSTTIIPVTILISHWFKDKRGLALSLAFSGLGIGGIVFSQLVTFLINTYNYQVAYMVYGSLMLIIGLPVILFIIKVKPEEMGLTPYGKEDSVYDKSDKQFDSDDMNPRSSKSILSGSFVLLLIGAVLVGVVNNSGFGQFPPVLANLHGEATAAQIISVYSGIGIIGKILLGHINDRYGAIKSTVYSTTLLALAYFAMLFSQNIVIAFVMAILFGLGNAISTVLVPLITSEIYSEESYSIAYGYMNSGVQLGMTIGSLYAAGVADFTGSYQYSWISIILFSILVGILWVSAYKKSVKNVV